MSAISTNKCNKCGEEKPFSEFYKDEGYTLGIRNTCKVCTKAYRIAHYHSNPEKYKAQVKKYREKNRKQISKKAKEKYNTDPQKYLAQAKAYREADIEKTRSKRRVHYAENREKLLAQAKAYRDAHPEKIIAQRKARYEVNSKKLLARHKAWREANPEKIRAYFRERYHTNIIYKLSVTYRVAVRRGFKLIKSGKKSASLDYLGCSWEEFLEHIRSLFTEGMTLDNHGLYGWHLDHIIPISSSETEEDVIRLSHYTNFQPLWAQDNYSKGNKLDAFMEKAK